MRARTFLFVVLACCAAMPGWSGPARLWLLGHEARIEARRVPLDPRDPKRRRLGALTFMGGVELTSPDPSFGGFSALYVAGDRFTLLSDGGGVVRFRLRSDGRVVAPTFGELSGGPGTGWRKRDRDSEALAVDPRTGTAWVAFERANAIWRFAPGLQRAEAWRYPRAMRRWLENSGAESLVRRRDGSFIAIQEESTGGPAGTREALVWHGDPTRNPTPAFRFRYVPPPGYDPSDATELPDGRLLILSRWFGLPLRLANIVEVIEPSAIRPGAVVRGRRIAQIAAPLTHDNFEGIAATVEAGHTVIWLVSDDNQTVFERTLLLKFRLDDRRESKRAPPRGC